MRVSVEVVVDVDFVRLDEVIVRELHLEVDALLIADEEHPMLFGREKLDNGLGSIGGLLLLATCEGCR